MINNKLSKTTSPQLGKPKTTILKQPQSSVKTSNEKINPKAESSYEEEFLRRYGKCMKRSEELFKKLAISEEDEKKHAAILPRREVNEEAYAEAKAANRRYIILE